MPNPLFRLIAVLSLGLSLLLSGCGDSQSVFSTPPVFPTIPPTGIIPTSNIVIAGTPRPDASKCQSRIQGRVTDATGQIAKEATVDITNGTVSAKAITDSFGLYGFAGLCAGTYNATATLQGKSPRPLPDKVIVDGANILKFDIVLK